MDTIPIQTYSGLDGHPRRITPIPITTIGEVITGHSGSRELLYENPDYRKGVAQVAKTMFSAIIQDEDEKSVGSTVQSSGANRPTIGKTTISTKEAKIIRDEV